MEQGTSNSQTPSQTPTQPALPGIKSPGPKPDSVKSLARSVKAKEASQTAAAAATEQAEKAEKPEIGTPKERGKKQVAQSVSAENPEAKPEAKPESKPEGEPKVYKVKIDGVEQEVTEKELLDGYQLRKASDKRFHEGAMMRKQAEEVFAKLKDPNEMWGILAKLGYNDRELAEKRLVEYIQMEKMTPEQRENYELKRKLAEKERSESETKKLRETEENQRLRQQYSQEYQSKILESLQSDPELPATTKTVRWMAYFMDLRMRRGLPAEPKDVIHLVKEEYERERKEDYAKSDGAKLVKLLGEDNVKKIQQHMLAQLKDPHGQNVKPRAAESPKPRRDVDQKPMDEYEFRAKMKKIRKGLR